MKQVLLTSVLALGAAIAFAETETNLNLVEGHTLLVSEIDGLGAADTDLVRFYINNNSGASREGWGIGGFANSDNWTPIVEWVGQAGTNWTYEYTVAKIKEVAGTTPGEWHDVGITINIYNDCAVDHVTLVGDIAPVTEQSLWEGEYTFDESWSGSVSIGKLNVKAGDKLVITAEPVQAVSWQWGSQVFVKSLADGWGAIAPTINVSQADSYTVAITDTDITVEPYNLDPYTSNMVYELNNYGLVLQGIDAKVTKVVLVKSGETSISEVEAAPAANHAIYNIAGQKLNAAKGLCVVNGKLIMVK
ncbi:MAG: hypothetical protein IKX59_02335 [Bacteroidales bacterium]|nr:hypothetical protein [Bacteroidales bacterium]